jgi:hypothetical protein
MAGLLGDIYSGISGLFQPQLQSPIPQNYTGISGSNPFSQNINNYGGVGNTPYGPTNPTPSRGTGGSSPISSPQPQQQQTQQSTFDPYDQLRGEINSGWDAYTGQLNDTLNTGLPGQRTAQEGIAILNSIRVPMLSIPRKLDP